MHLSNEETVKVFTSALKAKKLKSFPLFMDKKNSSYVGFVTVTSEELQKSPLNIDFNRRPSIKIEDLKEISVELGKVPSWYKKGKPRDTETFLLQNDLTVTRKVDLTLAVKLATELTEKETET